MTPTEAREADLLETLLAPPRTVRHVRHREADARALRRRIHRRATAGNPPVSDSQRYTSSSSAR